MKNPPAVRPTARMLPRLSRLIARALFLSFPIAVTSCDRQRDRAPQPEDPSAESPGPPDSFDVANSECTNSAAGFSVAVPVGWKVNSGDVMPACSLFDPSTVEVGMGSEVPTEIAIAITREATPFATASVGGPFRDDALREEFQVSGHVAERVEGVSTGAGLYDRGLRSYHYFVDLDGETLVATTFDAGSTPFDEKKVVLDRMMESLRFVAVQSQDAPPPD